MKLTVKGDDPASDPALAHSRRVIGALFEQPEKRSFAVRYWDGTVEPGGASPPAFTLRINRPGALRRMLLPPSELSIVESFLSGDVDVEGDLETAAVMGDAINARVRSPRILATMVRSVLALPSDDSVNDVREARAARRVRPAGKEHDKSRDREAIRYHYDVGNEFYALWLDERMVYSCAYFQSDSDSLETAQVAKLELVCRKLRLRPGDRFLDVGCGWGALIMHAARYHGVTALGITLSDEQAAFARRRIEEAGLSDRCKVEIRDYRDLPAKPAFDKIASIGMVEHVGLNKLPVYFAALHRALEPGGLLLNHGIVSVGGARPKSWMDRLEARLWRRDTFIDQYVFPDGKLVPFGDVVVAAEGMGFETRDVESLREHYVLTLREWLARLTRNGERAIALADERTYRTWGLYLSVSAFGFASGRLNVVQTLLSKPDAAGRSMLPLTRADLLPSADGRIDLASATGRPHEGPAVGSDGNGRPGSAPRMPAR